MTFCRLIVLRAVACDAQPFANRHGRHYMGIDCIDYTLSVYGFNLLSVSRSRHGPAGKQLSKAYYIAAPRYSWQELQAALRMLDIGHLHPTEVHKMNNIVYLLFVAPRG